MDYNELKQIYETNHLINFKLHSLEYVIEEDNNKCAIYAIDYPKNKKYYNSFDELMNNYLVYLEPLINSINIIQIKK